MRYEEIAEMAEEDPKAQGEIWQRIEVVGLKLWVSKISPEVRIWGS